VSSDVELLEMYAQTRSEEAFRELIGRYMGLVYGACCRQLGDVHLAQDATQGVFVLLSGNAGKLKNTPLAGWLLTTARYACLSIRRSRRRMERRERMAAMKESPNKTSSSSDLLAVLDDGLYHLGAADREALVLRYMQERSLKEVGAAMGVSEEAARKRVDRGMEKLRAYFERRGIAASTAAVAAVMTQQVASTLTPELQQVLTEGILHVCRAGAASTAAGAVVAKGVQTMLWMGRLKAAGIAAAVGAVIVVGGWLTAEQLAQPRLVAAATVAAPMKAAMAPATTTAAKKVDLSSPERALTSFCAALKNADRNGALECLTVDPKRQPTQLDASLADDLADNHRNKALRKAFGDAAVDMGDGVPAEAIIDVLLALGNKAQVDGETARMQFTVPDKIMVMLPENIASVARQWLGAPVYFVKREGGWKIDADRTLRVTMTVYGGPAVTGAEQEKRDVAVMLDVTNVKEEIAAQIENGDIASAQEAHQLEQRRIGQVLKNYGINGFSTNGVPAEAGAGGGNLP
jgi:RNA polymerase sigma factor (sigma-70 family)